MDGYSMLNSNTKVLQTGKNTILAGLQASGAAWLAVLGVRFEGKGLCCSSVGSYGGESRPLQ